MDPISVQSAEHIYFVCSGNIIRSAYAEIYAKSKGLDNVSSFGTTYFNNQIHAKTYSYLKELNLHEFATNFTPTHVSEIQNFPESSIFYVMTPAHAASLSSINVPKQRTHLLTSVLGYDTPIEDPYFTGNYEDAFTIIRKAIDRICDVKRGNL